MILLLCAMTGVAAPAVAPLMPMPSQMSLGEGKLAIDAGFSVGITGYSDVRLREAAARLTGRVARQTGITITGSTRPTLVVDCRAGGSDIPALGDDESYQLDIEPAGARLTAPTVTGALRGMETFSQLVAPGATSFSVPVLHIEDRPRFPWRGLMLDVARHWMPVDVIERNLEAMAAVKLNVFHWHLSDDQGFRVESKLFAKLHQAGSDGNFYTQAEVRRVIAYAAARSIRVIPEFDIPGHTSSWFAGYPQLASAPGPFAIERKWGIFEPTMDPSREEVYSFLDGFLGEMAALFPDEYFHIGGDEVLDAEWKRNPAIQDFAKRHGFQTSAELHAYFNQRVAALLNKHGKKMIGWDEVFHPSLASDSVIQSWRGQQSLADAARKGYRGVLSFGYYLDHLNPAAFHYRIDPLGGAASQLTHQQASLILGGEACMWSEYVTPETVDSRVWPRAAVVAERLWSPAGVNDAESMYRRLEAVNRWLEWSGVRHRANYQPMLERLAGRNPAPALQVLADAVESLGIDDRQSARQYSSAVALNRLVDAARPESESVRCLAEAVSRFLADTSGHKLEAAEIRLAFDQWSSNDSRLRPLLADSFLLTEIAPVSKGLSEAGSVGLRALQYLESGERAPTEWVAAEKQELDRMEKPGAEVSLAAVRPVRTLLDALSKPSISIDQAHKPGAGSHDK
ncbi:MAG TPA: family 20 glycosylhydrolase [Bryobacteraceae bacterium]|nr:family 20 glycosylhydrolase [Bryobacteraceae bacterium]